MANLRILADNVADTAALAASSSAGGLAVANLQDDERAAVWRSVGTSATLTATWDAAQIVDAVILGWSNLSALASVTVRGYFDPADSEPVVTATWAGTAPALGDSAWGVAPLGETPALASGTPQQTQIWFARAGVVRKIEIEIDDPENHDGYLQIARLAAGQYHEMAYNPAYGVALRIVDASTVSRAESLTLRIEPRGVYRALDLDFEYLLRDDVAYFTRLAAAGKKAIFVSMLPGRADHREQAYAMFCAQSGNHESAYRYVNAWTSRLTLEEIA